MEQLGEYVETLRFKKGLSEERLLVFGVELGNGTDKSHFHLGFTTIKLMLRIKLYKDGCYHIDATYKIVKYSYPLIVFGFSDVSRKFYPVAFMFTSHEETCDYEYFFQSFFTLCTQLEIQLKIQIQFKPKFIVSDASKAIRRAIKTCIPDAFYVTCWFHVKLNVKKHKKLIPHELYETTMTDVTRLHRTNSKANFDNLVLELNEKWTNSNMVAFKDYFNKQWLNSDFKTWAIYLTPPGYDRDTIVTRYNRHQLRYRLHKSRKPLR